MRYLNKHKRQQLQHLIDAHNWCHARKPKGISFATESDRALAFFRMMRDLHERLNISIEPIGLRRKHARALLRMYESDGQSASSLQK